MAELKTFLSPYLTGDVFALVYLVAGILFILGLKGLAHPSSARRGNNFAMLGMFIAILVTLFHPQITDYMWIFVPMALGALVGVPIALKINMTAMPQLVAILHSFVGLAAVLVAAGMFLPFQPQLINPEGVVSEGILPQLSTATMIEIFMGAWIGAITFTGSVVAFAKLNGNFRSAPITFKGQHLLNLAIFVAMIYFGVYFAMYQSVEAFVVMCALAFLLGFTLIIPIGGADMPVIVSMLNSYSGWAAAATGFTLNNMQLIIAGALIGSSGAILSYIMCKAMNRSFISVVLGGFGADDDPAASERASAVEKGVKAAAVEDAGYMLENAESVVIVPGYGMAVAQAQHALKEVSEILEEKGVKTRFAIHPVAGRMPGHMNVLLAEADVPYDRVEEMDEINSDFSQTDVVLVVGANDVVNPDAKEDPSSPLYGMPILDAYKAKMVYVVKRSMSSGYAGVENTLFYMDNTYMIFGDAKEIAENLSSSLKGTAH
ncbi:MAG: NAD(P)(+) transhydrogenase (Re/Si-specific) subunit beta [Pseudomonadota bacterium]|nr:NAD(P)(+) transhydrogenase (Re/Si-specific) subunit beta [Pseudomonadota bacterium]